MVPWWSSYSLLSWAISFPKCQPSFFPSMKTVAFGHICILPIYTEFLYFFICQNFFYYFITSWLAIRLKKNKDFCFLLELAGGKDLTGGKENVHLLDTGSLHTHTHKPSEEEGKIIAIFQCFIAILSYKNNWEGRFTYFRVFYVTFYSYQGFSVALSSYCFFLIFLVWKFQHFDLTIEVEQLKIAEFY